LISFTTQQYSGTELEEFLFPFRSPLSTPPSGISPPFSPVDITPTRSPTLVTPPCLSEAKRREQFINLKKQIFGESGEIHANAQIDEAFSHDNFKSPESFTKSPEGTRKSPEVNLKLQGRPRLSSSQKIDFKGSLKSYSDLDQGSTEEKAMELMEDKLPSLRQDATKRLLELIIPYRALLLESLKYETGDVTECGVEIIHPLFQQIPLLLSYSLLNLSQILTMIYEQILLVRIN
jgi:hypothetical protein